MYTLLANFRKVTVTDYQGICSPQESHQSAASKTFSESITTTIAILGNFLWSMAFGFNFQNLWQIAFAFAGESAKPLDGKVYLISLYLPHECSSIIMLSYITKQYRYIRVYDFRRLDPRSWRIRVVNDRRGRLDRGTNIRRKRSISETSNGCCCNTCLSWDYASYICSLSSEKAKILWEKDGSLYFTTRKIEYQRTKQPVEREINKLSRHRLREVRICTTRCVHAYVISLISIRHSFSIFSFSFSFSFPLLFFSSSFLLLFFSKFL